MLSKKNPEEKAWQLLRSIMDDDEKYFALKNQKQPILVEGNLGGKYYIYPNGLLARIDTDKPFIGKVTQYNSLPIADKLAAIYVWITQKEDDVKKLWGCGNIDLFYDEGRIINGNGLEVPNINDLNPNLEAIAGPTLTFTACM
jgi:hypothetical protein